MRLIPAIAKAYAGDFALKYVGNRFAKSGENFKEIKVFWLVGFGSVGLDWVGLGWIGLDWVGLVCWFVDLLIG